MKRFFVLGSVAIIVAMAFSINAFAAGGSAKIGCFDIQAAVGQSETGKKLIEDVKKEEERLGAALEQKGRTFMTAKEEYDKKREAMDEKTKNRKEKELTDMYTELQKMRSESQSKLNDQRNAAMAPIIKKVQEIANKIGSQERYDFIFEKGVVHYLGSEKDDLTKRITSELDKSR